MEDDSHVNRWDEGLLLVEERDEGVEDVDNEENDEIEEDEDDEVVGFLMVVVVAFVVMVVIVAVKPEGELMRGTIGIKIVSCHRDDVAEGDRDCAGAQSLLNNVYGRASINENLKILCVIRLSTRLEVSG